MPHNSGQSAIPKWVVPAVVGLTVAVLAFTATPAGATFTAAVQAFLAYFVGVFSLVAYSGAVMIGLLATERTMLGIRHRVMAQAAHRALAVAGTAFLVAHIFIKVLSAHATAAQAVVPSLTKVGTGAIAGDLFILVLITGILRAWFAAGRNVWLWRSLHALSYVAWPVSILHGLTAGRPPTGLGTGPLGPWVTVLYFVCMLGVGFALLTRLSMVVRPGAQQRPEHFAAQQMSEGFVAEIARQQQVMAEQQQQSLEFSDPRLERF